MDEGKRVSAVHHLQVALDDLMQVGVEKPTIPGEPVIFLGHCPLPLLGIPYRIKGTQIQCLPSIYSVWGRSPIYYENYSSSPELRHWVARQLLAHYEIDADSVIGADKIIRDCRNAIADRNLQIEALLKEVESLKASHLVSDLKTASDGEARIENLERQLRQRDGTINRQQTDAREKDAEIAKLTAATERIIQRVKLALNIAG